MRLLLFVLCGLLLAGLTGCQTGGDPAPRIGVVLPLSGPYAAYGRQILVTITPTTETRTRTVTKTGTRTVTDPETGEEVEEEYEYEEEEEYTVTILEVTLTARDLSEIVAGYMNEEQKEL